VPDRSNDASNVQKGKSGKESPVPRLVQIFDRPCCGPSAASQLADSLREHVDPDAVHIEYHNLLTGGVRSIRVPGALVRHMTAGGALPVLAVDGELVATGVLPDLMDALGLANGQPARAMPTRTGPATGDASAPGCC
jgi:hypothetical protein